mgnify:CR=1 FL=1
MTDYETLPVECPECDSVVREDLPPVDVLTTCDGCGHRFWIRPVDPSGDPGDDIPPGMLAVACLNGGGTQVVCGNLRGNTAIPTAAQAQAVNRMTGGATDINADISSALDREAQFEAHEQALRRGNHR